MNLRDESRTVRKEQKGLKLSLKNLKKYNEKLFLCLSESINFRNGILTCLAGGKILNFDQNSEKNLKNEVTYLFLLISGCNVHFFVFDPSYPSPPIHLTVDIINMIGIQNINPTL